MKIFSLKKSLIYVISTALLAGAEVALASKPDAEWVTEALERQYRLQKFQPLKKTKLFGTHNSYSSNSAIADLELYENQEISITAQLEGGARVLEIDLHYVDYRESDAIVVCHRAAKECGTTKEVNESLFLDNLLREIGLWAAKNPDQLLIFKFEDRIDDWRLVYAVQSLVRNLGHLVYRPDLPKAGEVYTIPWELTPYDILSTGKQIIIYGVGSDAYELDKGWMNEWVWRPVREKKAWSAYSSAWCDITDSNSATNVFDAAEEDWNPKDVFYNAGSYKRLSRCENGVWFGADWMNDDYLHSDYAKPDSRITNTIWSWEVNHPFHSGSACAHLSSAAGRIRNSYWCTNILRYACASKDNRADWKVTKASGDFSQGEQSCRHEYGRNYTFDMPRDGYEFKKLVDKTRSQGVDVWLNYSAANDNKKSIWVTGTDKAMMEGIVDRKKHALHAADVTSFISKAFSKSDLPYDFPNQDDAQMIDSCMAYNSGNKARLTACGYNNVGFTCYNPELKKWKITSQKPIAVSNHWSLGESRCVEEFGEDWMYAFPRTQRERVDVDKVLGNKVTYMNISKPEYAAGKYLTHGRWAKHLKDSDSASNYDSVANRLEIGYHNSHYLIWDDQGSGGELDGSFWRVDLASRFFGDTYGVGIRSKDALTYGQQPGYSLVNTNPDSVRAGHIKAANTHTQIWDSTGSGADADATFWRPAVNDPNYTCIGDLVENNYNNTAPTYSGDARPYCINNDFVVRINHGLGKLLQYDDRSTGADDDLSIWTSRGFYGEHLSSTLRDGFSQQDIILPNTFLAWAKHPSGRYNDYSGVTQPVYALRRLNVVIANGPAPYSNNVKYHHRYSVGVIPDYKRECPLSDLVTIHMDDEDDKNANSYSGWIGATDSSHNTTFNFCRVDGSKFDKISAPANMASRYSVLQLSEDCPPEAVSEQRFFDNQDKNNQNWFLGEISPNESGRNTLLKFCTFNPNYNSASVIGSFHDFGFSYGVIAPANFALGIKAGWLYTDDEDDKNANSHIFKPWPRPDGHYAFQVGRNTLIRVQKIKSSGLIDKHSMCLDVSGKESTSNGTNVGLWSCHADGTEGFVLGRDGKIRTSYNANVCLDVEGHNSSRNGANVGIWNCNEVSETFFKRPDGKISLGYKSSMCLDVDGKNNYRNNQNVGIWQCNQVTERFQFVGDLILAY